MLRRFVMVVLTVFWPIFTHGQQQKQVLFAVNAGSHIHPTFEIVRRLLSNDVSVTYLLLDTSSKEARELSGMGTKVISLVDELCSLNEHFTDEQKTILQNQFSNFVEQPEGADDIEVLSQYFMAQFWDELVMMVGKINPDVMVIDAFENYWGKYVGRALNIPTFVSYAPAPYSKRWKEPRFKDEVMKVKYQKILPPTPKRLWAAEYLQKKLGPLGVDIEVDFPIPFSDPAYATFFYTYPKLLDYKGEKFLGTSLVFAGSPTYEGKPLTREQEAIVDAVIKFKGTKKLVFISMGTDLSKPLEFFALLGEALGNGGDNKEINNDIVIALHPGPRIAKGVEQYKAQDVAQYMQQLGHTNFIVYDYFPLPYLFKEVDIFIGHGGHNSSMQALKNYVPMLLMPVYGDMIVVGETFHALGFAKTIPDIIVNPMKYRSNFLEWEKFISNAEKRSALVQWMRQSVYESLVEIDTPEKHALYRQKIDTMLQNDQSYDTIVELIMAATT